MEIKVGEYIRTKEGIIGKVKIIEGYCVHNLYLDLYFDIYSNMREHPNIMEFDVVKHSTNIIELLEDEDVVILEYKSPKYKKRISRKFEVCRIEDSIFFENAHCYFNYKVGDRQITDTLCKNIKIKSIVTKEQFKRMEYKLKE